jgi:hypothetical protein
VQQIYASDAHSGDKFGVSVALSGDLLAVGAYLDDDGEKDSGSVYLYQRDAGGSDNWGEIKKLAASVASKSDRFGISVALDGTTLVVGANKYDGGKSDAGAAYIFEQDAGGAGNWGQVKLLTASDRGSYDKFGVAVAINAGTVVVGSNQDNNGGGSDAGSAYVFAQDEGGAGNWGELAKLTASDGDSDYRFGTSVAASTGTLVVGGDAEGEDTGAAYVFEPDGAGGWSEVALLTGSDTVTYDLFGGAVAALDGTVLVGAPDHAGGGAAYVFEKVGGSWIEVKKLVADDADDSDQFGVSVTLSGSTQVVGASFADSGGADTGAVYIFP